MNRDKQSNPLIEFIDLVLNAAIPEVLAVVFRGLGDTLIGVFRILGEFGGDSI